MATAFSSRSRAPISSKSRSRARPSAYSRAASGLAGSEARTAMASDADTAASPSFSRRRAPARVTTASRSASVPFSETRAIVSPAAASWRRRSRRSVPPESRPGARYEPRRTRSAPRFDRTRESVSRDSVSVSGSARSIFMRETSSLETARSFSPAASSVVSISESAVETQTSSGRCARFLKPRTAIARRGAFAAAAAPGCGARRRRRRRAPARTASATAAAMAASMRRFRTRRPGPGATRSPSSASATSRADRKRSAGSRSRQRRIAFSQTAGSSGASARGEGAASFNFLKATESGVSPRKGGFPVTVSYITIPSAYMSAAGVRSRPSICSGAM